MRNVLVLLLLLCGGAFTLCAGPKAQWIAYPEKPEDGMNQERYFLTEFEVPAKPVKQAFITYIIDDYGSVSLNGQLVGPATNQPAALPAVKRYDVTKLVSSGRNVLTAVTVNAGGGGGFILRLSITYQDGTVQELFTDGTWKSAKEKAANQNWQAVKTLGDYNADPWAPMNDMIVFYAHDDEAAELARREQNDRKMRQYLDDLAKAPAEQARVVYKNGGAFFDIGGKLYRPVLYNCNFGWRNAPDFRRKIHNFAEADIYLVSFAIEAEDFWKGPGQFDYKVLDKALESALDMAPDGRFSIGIGFSHGPKWWNELHPEETVKYARVDTVHPKNDCIGTYTAPSYASELWKKEASETVRKAIEYIESRPYAKRVFAYRIDAGVYQEWHYYGMAESMPDVSAPMTKLFRSFLKEKYKGDVAALRKAWNQPEVTFDNALPPPVEVRLQYRDGSFRDPVKHAWSIDFLQCIQRSLRDALLLMDRTAKEACKGRALVGNYCGYFFGMGYSAEGWHLVNDEFMRSPYVDFQVSPCCYTNFFRGLGSTQLSRGLTASYRLHNKINIFEADGRTCLSAQDGNKHVNTMQETIAMLSRDLAQAISKGCAYWYFDFGRDWYNDPDILKYFHRIAPVYDAVRDFRSGADVAVIADWESAYYHAIQAPHGGPQSFTSINYLPQELKRGGMQFDAYSFADLDHPALQDYKLYIFPQLLCVTPAKLAKLAKLKKAGKTLLFMGTPGWLTPQGTNIGFIFRTTGIRANVLERTATQTTTLTDGSTMDTFGGPIGRGRKFSPILNVTDTEATILGTVKLGNGKAVPSYAKKKNADGSVSYVCGSPILSTQELKRIAREAGVHLYCDSEKGVVFANSSMISFHTGTPGEYTLRAKQPVKWTMVFPEKRAFPDRQAALTFEAPLPNTYIFAIEP